MNAIFKQSRPGSQLISTGCSNGNARTDNSYDLASFNLRLKVLDQKFICHGPAVSVSSVDSSAQQSHFFCDRGDPKISIRGARWRLGCACHGCDGYPGASGIAWHPHQHAGHGSTRHCEGAPGRRPAAIRPLRRREIPNIPTIKAVEQTDPRRRTSARLAFADHVDYLVADQRAPGSPKRTEALAGVNPPLDGPVVPAPRHY